ncbi:cadherin-related family member 3-like [Aplochiton taeniatus]
MSNAHYCDALSKGRGVFVAVGFNVLIWHVVIRYFQARFFYIDILGSLACLADSVDQQVEEEPEEEPEEPAEEEDADEPEEILEEEDKETVSVTGTTELNFETTPNRFVFHIWAVDTEEGSDLQKLTVILTDVDEPPIFLDEESILYVLEKTPPKEIYTPSVADPEDKPLTFKLVPPIPGFEVDGNSGALFTTKEFNYQTDPRSFAFNLSVSDGNNTVSKTLLVNIMNINDDKPQFLNKITSFTVREEMSPGGVVTNITAVVPETSSYTGFIFYTIKSANSYLVINRCLVTIASKMDRDSSPLRENPMFSVAVTATFSPSGPPLFNTITLEITVEDINDNPPICFPGAQRVEILETEPVRALITTVTCTDNDVDPAFTDYQITGLSCQGCDRLFALDPPGSNRIVLTGDLDFEGPANLFGRREYSLTVVAEDKDDPTLKGSAYVYVTVSPVNEFPPVFNPPSYFYRISELLGCGAVIGAVKATDADLPPTDVQYSIISGGGGVYSNIFFLDPKLGSISLLSRPDYETTQTYILIIRATDGDPTGPRFATATVTINVTEANDEPPLCGPNKTNLVVPKDLRTGSIVQGFQLSCNDLDSPPSSFIYSISGASNLNNHFVFSPSSGTNLTKLILREPFDFESGLDRVWFYCLTVLISDGNLRAGELKVKDPIQTGTVIINIQVVDPYLTTVITTATPRVTYIALTENSFSMDDWYVWFFVALGAMLLLGILGYLLYHCCRWLSTLDCSCCQCQPTPVEDTEAL